ncbi:MAG: MFS transporter [Dehalococcoidia bacterium]
MGAGAFFLPIAREFGTTRGALSWAYAAIRLEGGLTGPIEGFLIDKFGPRRVMLVGWFVFGLGFILLSEVRSLPQFYVAFLITALGNSLSGFLPIATCVVNWFMRRRGTALGIVLAGNSLGGVFVPVLALSITNFGWRPTAAGVGVFVMLVGLPIASVMRRRPEDYGYMPDGAFPREAASDIPASHVDTTETDSPGDDTTVEHDMSARQALKTSAFWLLALSHSGSLTAWSAVAVHLIPALVDNGLSEPQAASIFGVLAIVATASRLAGGILGDRLGLKRVLIASFVVQAVAMVVLAFTTTTWQAILFAVLMGIGFGARGPLNAAFRGNLFGRSNFATISGAMEPITMIGLVIAPVFAGLVYDSRQSYTLAFLTIALVNAASALFVLPIRRPSPAVPKTGVSSLSD